MDIREVEWRVPRLGLSGSGQGQVANTSEWSEELSGSIKCGKFLD